MNERINVSSEPGEFSPLLVILPAPVCMVNSSSSSAPAAVFAVPTGTDSTSPLSSSRGLSPLGFFTLLLLHYVHIDTNVKNSTIKKQ